MNRVTINSLPLRLLFLTLVLLQVACGSSDELSVRGGVSVNANNADHVFSFPGTINLAPDGFEEDVFAGHCEFQGQYVSVGITRPGSDAEGLSQFSLQTAADGVSVEVFVDGSRYAGDCEIDVLYSDECDGVFGAALNCSDLGGAAVNGELHFAGCDSF